MEPLILEYPLGDNPPKAALYYGANSLQVLRSLPANSIHTVVTSPPYYCLRDYGTKPEIWGGKANCKHSWDEVNVYKGSPARAGGEGLGFHNAEKTKKQRWSRSGMCSKCGAWCGELGGEPTPELYVQHLTEIFREVRRVLHPSGTCWLNISDSYNGSGGAGGDYNKDGIRAGQPKYGGRKVSGSKQKDMLGIPWMVAFALRTDGWWLRSEIIWAKAISFCPTYVGQCMPASVRDRPVSSHEHVFLLAKSQKYFYDLDACKEHWADDREGCPGGDDSFYNENARTLAGEQGYAGAPRNWEPPPESKGRNLRSVWTVNPQGFSGAHFATFPPKLIEPMIKLGASERGCCPKCKAPWSRTAEQVDVWEPICRCNAGAPIPCTVLDPFCGSGTTGMVSLQNHRDFVGIDLQQAYLPLAQERILGMPVAGAEPAAGDYPVLDMFKEW